MLRHVLVRRRSVLGSISSRLLPRVDPGTSQDFDTASARNHDIPQLHSISDDPTNHPLQVRWKRRDGHSSFNEPRRATRKQKKEYRKREREVFHEKVGKHSPPNSKASIRRQEAAEERQNLLNWDEEDPSDNQKYGYRDLLLDDLMGNTTNLSSTPTPEPVYLGHKHQFFYNRVAFQMQSCKEAVALMEAKKNEKIETPALDMPALPTDYAISMVVRSYRDKNGTRLKPVGVAKVLEHLLKDLELPISAFGEETFTSILTCCITPAEARRIFRLMMDIQHPVSSYSWSILVDIHAKLGDFQGSDSVMREMVTEGVSPSLAAYTSLLAGCFRTCNSGIIPHSVREQAGKLAWEKWKEMRIVGVDADVMAYGAMLRICAARGQAELALNLLEEMPSFEVKPTTLCFSSALKAIARSHHIAIRFENGASPRYRKRQEIASYFGRLARKVVIAAESCEVQLDDGFIANLILCAGAAGDSATAKAILLASEVRKLDHLRRIGAENDVSRMVGDPRSDSKMIDTQLSQLFSIDGSHGRHSESGSMLANVDQDRGQPPETFLEREYGKDSRVLSALMQACSQAIDSRGLGTIWEGRGNKGYLCEGSLLALTIKPKPKYMDNSIPGVSSTEVGLGSLVYKEEDTDNMSKRLRRAKFTGFDVDDSGTNMDDLDPYIYKMFEADDHRVTQGNPDARKEVLPSDDPAWDIRGSVKSLSPKETQAIPQTQEEWFFDVNERKWKSRMTVVQDVDESVDDSRHEINYNSEDELDGKSRFFFDATAGKVRRVEDGYKQNPADDITEEWFFDQTDRKWKTRSPVMESESMVQPVLTKFEVESLAKVQERALISYPSSTINYRDISESEHAEEDDSKLGFDQFVHMLEQETESGDRLTFTESEARELYNLMDDGITTSEENDGFTENSKVADDDFNASQEEADPMSGLTDAQNQMMKMMQSLGIEVSVEGQEDPEWFEDDANDDDVTVDDENEGLDAGSLDEGKSSHDLTAHPVESERDLMVEELKAVLPGMPEKRLRQVASAFESNLGYPSILTLTPILRENMPERVTSAWLQRKNIQNASFVMKKAMEDGLVDVHMMNGMLQVECSTGSIDRALACHEIRFKQNGVEPTQYSDRIVLQMLVQNHRLSRALSFKDKVEESGRILDVLSYGSLIEYYAKHRQIGSSLMMLKECVRVNGSPPNEYSLNALRRLCRHQHLTDKTGLAEYAGPDPLEWLREGEAKLKRENSKRGNRGVQLPRNRAVHI